MRWRRREYSLGYSRGHSDFMYLDMILMGIGALIISTGDLSGLVLLAIGGVLHFSAGGFATGF